jgi:hypothetical protein
MLANFFPTHGRNDLFAYCLAPKFVRGV